MIAPLSVLTTDRARAEDLELERALSLEECVGNRDLADRRSSSATWDGPPVESVEGPATGLAEAAAGSSGADGVEAEDDGWTPFLYLVGMMVCVPRMRGHFGSSVVQWESRA